MIKKLNWKLLLIAIILFSIIIYILTFHFHEIKKINLKLMEDYINSYGQWSVMAFLVVSTIRPLAVVIPITLMTLIAGGLYGPLYGFLLAMVSIVISSNVAFLISRYIGRSFVERLIKKRAEKVNLKIGEKGFKIIFIMRISGVFPLDIVSYAAGLTKVRYRDFMLATVLGAMPETFSVAYMGHHIKNPLSPGFILSVILVVTTVGIPLIYNRHKAKESDDNKIEKIG